MCQILSGLVYAVPSDSEKPEFLPFFGFRHLVMLTVGGNLRKMNTGAQPQTFPCATASKSFLYSHAFMAKSGAQTLIPHLHDTTECQMAICSTRLSNRVVQPVWQPCWTNSHCSFNVLKEQPLFASTDCQTGLYNRYDNRQLSVIELAYTDCVTTVHTVVGQQINTSIQLQ